MQWHLRQHFPLSSGSRCHSVDVKEPVRTLSVCPQECIRKCVLRWSSYEWLLVSAVFFADIPVTRSPSPIAGETTAAVQEHSWVDFWLWPKCQKSLWCELTTRTARGSSFCAVWCWMYMLVCQCVGLQDAFVSWALSIYEQVQSNVHTPNILSCEKCSRVGWA